MKNEQPEPPNGGMGWEDIGYILAGVMIAVLIAVLGLSMKGFGGCLMP